MPLGVSSSIGSPPTNGLVSHWEGLKPTMTTTKTNSPVQAINEASTKAAIIEAAKEFISLQDEDLSSKAKLTQALQEEKQALTYVLIATSSFGFLF